MTTPDPPGERLGMEEVRDRAVGGAAVLGARGAVVFGLGIVANLALARMLNPRDFGLVALGTVLLMFGNYVADGGIGAALIRRERPPERGELEAVAGLQLVVATAIAAVAAGAAAAFGSDGLVIALMLVSLPITTLRLPAGLVLDRQLTYRPTALVDLVEAISYYAWALTAVALGLGVWGLASAVVARSLIGALTMMRVGPVGFVRPRWAWERVRRLVGFGMKFQAATVSAMIRDQGLNIGIASIAGIATLGVWSLAYRVLQIPMMIITVTARVFYPAMSRLLEAREDPRPVIEHAVAAASVVMAIVLVPLVGFAPALPHVLGDGWGGVPATLLWSALALILSTPVTVATIGYLMATDRAGTVVWAMLWHTLLWFAIALPLLPSVGAPAIGLGWVPAAVLLAALMGRRAAAHTGARLVRSLGVPTAVAVAAGAVAWTVGSSTSQTVLGGVLGIAAGAAVLLAGLALARAELLSGTYSLARRAVRGAPARG